MREQLEDQRYAVGTEFDPAPPLPFLPRLTQSPRPYQEAALDAWLEAGARGVVVLPTGAGKTLVALLAVARQRVWTMIVVPTLDLLEQWRTAAIEVLGAPAEQVGIFGGGRRELAPVTIITYNSAAIHTRELNRFGLLVFDEVHHLPAQSYRLAAEGTVAPFRLGLSATPERTDGLEKDLAHLVGPVVYARSPRELAAHLAPYREERITIALSPEEQEAYEAAMTVYRAYLRRNRIRITSPEDFQRLVIWPSAANPEARRAMLAHREARRLAFNAGAKTATLLRLLERHREERVLIFSEFTSVVEGIEPRSADPEHHPPHPSGGARGDPRRLPQRALHQAGHGARPQRGGGRPGRQRGHPAQRDGHPPGVRAAPGARAAPQGGPRGAIRADHRGDGRGTRHPPPSRPAGIGREGGRGRTVIGERGSRVAVPPL